MSINMSYWIYYGVNISKYHNGYETNEDKKLYEYFETNELVASPYMKKDLLRNKNTILYGEDLTVFGKVLNFCNEDEYMYNIFNQESDVVYLEQAIEDFKKEIDEKLFLSIRQDLKSYFNIDNEIPKLLFITYYS